MCVLLQLLICTALRAHIIVVEALYKINYYYYFRGGGGGGGLPFGRTTKLLGVPTNHHTKI